MFVSQDKFWVYGFVGEWLGYYVYGFIYGLVWFLGFISRFSRFYGDWIRLLDLDLDLRFARD